MKQTGFIKAKLSSFAKEGETLVVQYRDQDSGFVTTPLLITSLVELDGETKIPFKQWRGSGETYFKPAYYPKEFYIYYEYNQ